ncbi:MAG: MFS transporter, partial [Dehalococcoidia bacterium]
AMETVGMVIGAVIAMRIRVNRLLRLGVICMLGEIPLMFAMAEAPELAALIPAAFAAGVAFEQFGIAWESTMQRYIPADKLARVYSYDALGSFLAIPLGQIVAGPVALRWGTSATLIGASVLSLVAVVAMLLVRDVRTLPTSPPKVLASGSM